MQTWKFLTSAAMLFALTTVGRADDYVDPCAEQYKAWQAMKYNSPEYEAANKVWKACSDEAIARKKAEFVATRATWAANLDALPGGGWALIDVGADGTYAVYGSRRHATREGNVVSIWMRWEHRESKWRSDIQINYKSTVERDMYDCGRVATKLLAITYYPENNLSGIGPSYTYDEKPGGWTPAIPGTVGDELLDWACKAIPQPAKAK